MLLRNYTNINYILNLEFTEGFELISKAFEKDIEKMLWDRWLIDYRNMTKETFISFNDYKNNLLNINIDTTSKEELLSMADEIENQIESKKRGGSYSY